MGVTCKKGLDTQFNRVMAKLSGETTKKRNGHNDVEKDSKTKKKK